MSPNIACGPVKVFTTPIFTVCAAAVLASTQANANAAMRFISLLHDRQHQRRRIFRSVVERVLADLVRLVVMRPEDSVIGESPFAISRRMRLPCLKRKAFGSMLISKRYTSPGLSGS